MVFEKEEEADCLTDIDLASGLLRLSLTFVVHPLIQDVESVFIKSRPWVTKPTWSSFCCPVATRICYDMMDVIIRSAANGGNLLGGWATILIGRWGFGPGS